MNKEKLKLIEKYKDAFGVDLTSYISDMESFPKELMKDF